MTGCAALASLAMGEVLVTLAIERGCALQLIRSLEREYIPVRGEEAVEFGIDGCTGIADARTVRSTISRTATKKLGRAGLLALRRATTGACRSRP